ncbi:phenylalanyl-tRNA synthetase alpha subunit, mitochondrial [Coemansia thaxteri]|nr:phenylalanyl-tRNA synthetase alpha subunit, mitochondrial [Coemansia thaxteri]KAJ2473758.1 phenylalanyl-tRNA synthetase alpha subunit, mitochondrial [Coemansia sp. RSA 2322]KAJ2487244.1 phenylalanyl-tRNA synthetase alpha subunit, mitochondrial [Coemansia sp. RSA 2320]
MLTGVLPSLGRSGLRKATCVVQKHALHSRALLSTSSTRFQSDVKQQTTKVLDSTYTTDEWTNTSAAILDKTGRDLLHHPSHPLAILKELIFKEFPTFAHYDSLSPVVTTQQNFDSLGFSADHPGRSRTDTYYINQDTLLRTHTSAHQLQLLAAGSKRDSSVLGVGKNTSAAPGNERFLVAADVYRRDEIDASHYPVFHQMEGVCTFSRDEVREKVRQGDSAARDNSIHAGLEDETAVGEDNPIQAGHSLEEVEFVVKHMKQTMNTMVVQILRRAVAAQQSVGSGEEGPGGVDQFPVRWINAYFPFTSPSWEMEVLFQGEWLEICGCGVMKQGILDQAGMAGRMGWAFGFGLERLAMLLFGVPDIRLFWSSDPRFTGQFVGGQINTFKAFSRHPACAKDVSFWLSEDRPAVHENDIMDLVRETAGDLVEGVKLVDSFTHGKTGRASRCYRINYCSMDRNVTNEEINGVQERVRQGLVERFGVTLR